MLLYSDPWSSKGSVVKNLPANAGDTGSIPVLERFPGEKKWQPTPVFLPGESHGQRSLVGYSPRGCKKAGHDFATKQHLVLLTTSGVSQGLTTEIDGGDCALRVERIEAESQVLNPNSMAV
ncbi:unnamed protein product [Rangifer tarandus platyrhynchus]|uniref:Uncharacterized protein n=2 Tax=Rangifer tarandus platyrhynchus TaxID=3082113 RepID=A0AC59YX37_RANTA|nr:unnamed protein product [Rangifer tarandus platyrhynchus]